MYTGFWSDFSLLLLAAIFGSIAILPYSLRLLKESPKKKKLKLPLWMILLLSILQNIVLFSLAIGIGLLAARSIGIGVDIFGGMYHLLPGLFLGIVAGFFLLAGDILFLPYFPEKLMKTTLQTSLWENFSASFYGGINEEFFTRLFGVSVVTWLLSRIWHTPNELPTASDFWIAITLMSVIFALGHLPSLKNLLGKITRPMLLRTILLNTPIGLLCGWVFWRFGIQAAILTHFTADIVYHVGGTLVLRKIKQS
jgi:hypothetical protein